jgi:hypothetical protein
VDQVDVRGWKLTQHDYIQRISIGLKQQQLPTTRRCYVCRFKISDVRGVRKEADCGPYSYRAVGDVEENNSRT